MGRSSKLSLALFLAIIALVIGSTALKVMNRHNEKLIHVASNKIEEAARKCYLEENCTGEATTLDALIQNGYIDSQVHPISKEFISGSLIITCKDFSCETVLS